MRRHRRILAAICVIAAQSMIVSRAHAQASAAAQELRVTVDSLFAAMARSDTVAIRAAFVSGARVVIMPPLVADTAPKPTALQLDDFVRSMGQNPPGSWIERAWNPQGSIDGSLGHVWFEYDINRGSSAPVQCGINSVQLAKGAKGWKIMSMAFTSRRVNCPAR